MRWWACPPWRQVWHQVNQVVKSLNIRQGGVGLRVGVDVPVPLSTPLPSSPKVPLPPPLDEFLGPMQPPQPEGVPMWTKHREHRGRGLRQLGHACICWGVIGLITYIVKSKVYSRNIAYCTDKLFGFNKVQHFPYKRLSACWYFMIVKHYLRFICWTSTKASIRVPGSTSSLDVWCDTFLAEIASNIDMLRRPLSMFVVIGNHIKLCTLIPETQTVQ